VIQNKDVDSATQPHHERAEPITSPTPTPHIDLAKGKPINMQHETEHKDTPDSATRSDQPGEPGADGGSHSDAKDKLPGAPSDDSSDVGDTDQHSNA
jgi:hypothetical protein